MVRRVPKLKSAKRPEDKIRDYIVNKLRTQRWLAEKTHGNAHQSGFPDIYAVNRRYGQRWIEVKRMTGVSFTESQRKCFPKWDSAGVGIWVLQAENQLDRLFKAPNWAGVMALCGQKKVRKQNPNPRGSGRGPERDIQDEIIANLEDDGWFVRETAGGYHQSGFPDLYATKPGEGQRWIEVKVPTGYKFQGSQMEMFPRICAEGVGIWILTSGDLGPLFDKPNWRDYL